MRVLNTLISRTINQMRGSLKQNIFFLHIPKCAGNALRHAITAHYHTLDFRKDQCVFRLNPIATVKAVKTLEGMEYPYDTKDDYSILKFRENLLLYYMSQENIKFICGHFTYSDVAYEKFHNKYAFITILRDPVKRYLSSYFFNKYKKNPRFEIKEDIVEYMQTYFGQSQGFEYVKFLGGANRYGDYTSRTAIDRAKENLDKMDMVGILEYFEDFCDRFKKLFRVNLVLEQRNKSPKSESYRKSLISDEIKHDIRIICKPDLELYQYAVEKYTKND
jgi:hypothetical protein